MVVDPTDVFLSSITDNERGIKSVRAILKSTALLLRLSHLTPFISSSSSSNYHSPYKARHSISTLIFSLPQT
ncbi:hypothetical protein MJO29_008463 [Puccinia striiformis f. sp. tritici]|nr:hypothetical protein MJO29_008463 [Puccinia striiformis f. sp. tritici]